MDKASTLGTTWMFGRHESRRSNQVLALGLILVALLLASASVYLLAPVLSTGGSSGAAAGIEAASARWSALGAFYMARYEAAAAASSARWQALGQWYASRAVKTE